MATAEFIDLFGITWNLCESGPTYGER